MLIFKSENLSGNNNLKLNIIMSKNKKDQARRAAYQARQEKEG